VLVLEATSTASRTKDEDEDEDEHKDDNLPPRVLFPERTVLPCVSPDGAPVHYSVAAVDDCDPEAAILCEPPSGSVFPAGTTTVTCTATDASQNRASQEFAIIVTGGCGPDRCVRFSVPDELTVPCDARAGAVVRYEVTATNTCTGARLTVTCEARLRGSQRLLASAPTADLLSSPRDTRQRDEATPSPL
jgi:hypothetical protein